MLNEGWIAKQETLEIQTPESEPQPGCCTVTLVELVISSFLSIKWTARHRDAQTISLPARESQERKDFLGGLEASPTPKRRAAANSSNVWTAVPPGH